MMPLTWSWLGGYFQAEGCITRALRTSISTCDRGALELVQDFLSTELSCNINLYGPYTYSTNVCINPKPLYNLTMYGRTTAKLLHYLLPYLHTVKKAHILKGTNLTSSEEPLNDDWIMGFWEGDGTLWPNGSLDFIQKDVDILNRIQTQLQMPSKVYPNTGNTVHHLTVYAARKTAERIGALLALVRTPMRIEQVHRVLLT